jgi:hypothetical protein
MQMLLAALYVVLFTLLFKPEREATSDSFQFLRIVLLQLQQLLPAKWAGGA